jgi:hypothetical protein
MSTETYTVGLVGCASQKLKRPAPARELYVSQLFKKASAYAELTCDRWYVLSAKHGLVHPDTVLEPYDMKLGTLLGPPVKHWSAVVRNQLADELNGIGDFRLVALCRGQYRNALDGSKWQYEVPMEGMGIGQQLGWLTGKLAAAGPAPA